MWTYCLVNICGGMIMDAVAVYNNECPEIEKEVIAKSDNVFELIGYAKNLGYKSLKFDVTNVHIGRIPVVKLDMDLFDCICICPHCGKKVRYGDLMLTNGIHNCPHCNVEVNMQTRKDQELDYEEYARKMANHEYEPYKYSQAKE